jgi:hypothetical protein
MTDAVLNRLAQRLLKCPFDDELFDSAASIESHLVECHEEQICQWIRVPMQVAEKDAERPTKIYICGVCRRFMVPNTAGRYPLGEIPRHIEDEHTDPSRLRPAVSILCSTDPEFIDRCVGEQDACACCGEGCNQVFSDVEAAVVHWTKEHVEHAKAEDVQRVLQANPEQFCERFDDVIAEVLAACRP